MLDLQVLALVEPGQQQQVGDQRRHPLRLALDALQRVLGHGGQLVGLLPGELGVSADGGERGAQLVARVGDELAHPPIGVDPLGQRGVDVVQHLVERLAHHTDLALKVGVTLADPRGDAVLGGLQRKSGDVTGDRGDPPQRRQGVAHQNHRRYGGRHQRDHDEYRHDERVAGQGRVGGVQRHRRHQALTAAQVAAAHLVGPGLTQPDRSRFARRPHDGLEIAHHVRRRGRGILGGEPGGEAHLALAHHRDHGAGRLTGKPAEFRRRDGSRLGLRDGEFRLGVRIAKGRQRVGDLPVDQTDHLVAQCDLGHRAHREHRGAHDDADSDDELAAQGARPPPPVCSLFGHCGGRSMYPTPRTVWIIGSRPASILRRR